MVTLAGIGMHPHTTSFTEQKTQDSSNDKIIKIAKTALDFIAKRLAFAIMITITANITHIVAASSPILALFVALSGVTLSFLYLM
jgi:hypothetical protein